MEKTNVMRILDQKKIKYEVFSYPHEEGVCVEGSKVAELLNQDSNLVFKTLVCISNTKRYYVCCIPVNKEIDLKKAAKALNVKSLEMIHVKDLFSIFCTLSLTIHSNSLYFSLFNCKLTSCNCFCKSCCLSCKTS